MNDGIHSGGVERRSETIAISKIRFYEIGSSGHCVPMTFGEIVDHRDVMTSIDQLVRNDAADVPSSTGDEYSHRTLPSKLIARYEIRIVSRFTVLPSAQQRQVSGDLSCVRRRECDANAVNATSR